MAKPPCKWLSLGRGGWSMHWGRHTEGSLTYGNSTLSHYGNTWREHLDDLAPDALGTDSLVIPDSEIVTWAVHGPMADVDLEPGLVRGWSATWVWNPRGEALNGRDPRFGNAGSFDYVALDVYVEILKRFGGVVFDPFEEAEQLAAEAA